MPRTRTTKSRTAKSSRTQTCDAQELEEMILSAFHGGDVPDESTRKIAEIVLGVSVTRKGRTDVFIVDWSKLVES